MEEKTATKPNILMRRKEDQELRIYFFIGNKQDMMVQYQSDKPVQKETKVFYVTAFKLEEAFELAKMKGQGFQLLYTAQNPTVREFLHELELESVAFEALEKEKEKPQKVKIKEIELPKEELVEIKRDLNPAKMSFKKFRAGLLYCANEKGIIYEEPRDKETLKKIIGGLRYRSSK